MPTLADSPPERRIPMRIVSAALALIGLLAFACAACADVPAYDPPPYPTVVPPGGISPGTVVPVDPAIDDCVTQGLDCTFVTKYESAAWPMRIDVRTRLRVDGPWLASDPGDTANIYYTRNTDPHRRPPVAMTG